MKKNRSILDLSRKKIIFYRISGWRSFYQFQARQIEPLEAIWPDLPDLNQTFFSGLTNYNAIAVQLFAIADQYEDRSIDLLKGAFEAFPRANWAILTVPRQVQHFRLLDYFQR